MAGSIHFLIHARVITHQLFLKVPSHSPLSFSQHILQRPQYSVLILASPIHSSAVLFCNSVIPQIRRPFSRSDILLFHRSAVSSFRLSVVALPFHPSDAPPFRRSFILLPHRSTSHRPIVPSSVVPSFRRGTLSSPLPSAPPQPLVTRRRETRERPIVAAENVTPPITGPGNESAHPRGTAAAGMTEIRQRPHAPGYAEAAGQGGGAGEVSGAASHAQ